MQAPSISNSKKVQGSVKLTNKNSQPSQLVNIESQSEKAAKKVKVYINKKLFEISLPRSATNCKWLLDEVRNFLIIVIYR